MRKACSFAGYLSIVALGSSLAYGADAFVVHEWGTITTIHQPSGSPVTGLNRIALSEVLPDFVHRFEPEQTRQFPLRSFGKSPAVPGRPDVTLRLETPVMYFYPPPNGPAPGPFDVTVSLRGGILNEFYPNAAASVDFDRERIGTKLQSGPLSQWDGAVLNDYVMSTLAWKGIKVGDEFKAPLTDNPIWLAPRAVRSTGVIAPNGEGERYIFYRGVAHLDALMQTQLTSKDIRLRSPVRMPWYTGAALRIPRVWVVQVRRDGLISFADLGEVTLDPTKPDAPLARLPRFPAESFGIAGARNLRESLRDRLERAGLYRLEALAMLETWKASWFEKPGLRVFYIVPEEWTRRFLPLEISVPAQVTRVIVGRIDLVQ